MPRPGLTLAVLALLLAAPRGGLAQDKAELCRDVQSRPMRLGQWASYAWTGGRADGTTMRFAIVGTAVQEGTTYYWYEMAMDNPKQAGRGKMIVQMLVPGLGYQTGGVRGMIMKNGDEPATRMPDRMVRMMGSRMAPNVAAEMTRACLDMEVVGWEEVTVPAGTFRALHIRHAEEQTEAWLRPELYFAMVKVVTKDGTMALAGHGTGAKSSIIEQPREMLGPPR